MGHTLPEAIQAARRGGPLALPEHDIPAPALPAPAIPAPAFDDQPPPGEPVLPMAVDPSEASSSSSGRFTVDQQQWLEAWCEATRVCNGNGPFDALDLWESSVQNVADIGVADGIWRQNEHSIGHVISFCVQWHRMHPTTVD